MRMPSTAPQSVISSDVSGKHAYTYMRAHACKHTGKTHNVLNSKRLHSCSKHAPPVISSDVSNKKDKQAHMHTRASSRPKAHRKYAHALKATRHTHRIKALFCFFFCTAGIDLLIFLDSNMILTMHLCVAVPNEQQRCEAVAALAGGRVCQHAGHGMPGKLHLGVLFICTCLYVMVVDCS